MCFRNFSFYVGDKKIIPTFFSHCEQGLVGLHALRLRLKKVVENLFVVEFILPELYELSSEARNMVLLF